MQQCNITGQYSTKATATPKMLLLLHFCQSFF